MNSQPLNSLKPLAFTILLCVAFLALPTEPVLAQQEKASATEVKAAIDQLSQDNVRVASRCVGRGAKQSKFHKFTQTLLEHGDKATFLKLLKSKNVVCRIAGMLCLSQKHPKLAAVEVRKFLSSKAEVMLQEGCCVGKTTEGAIAKRFVENVYWLGSLGKEKTPLPKVS